MTLADGAACHQKTTDLDGTVYIFAQSLGEKAAAAATIAVEGLKAGTSIEVVDENRSLTAGAGQFRDDFAPLAAHVYKFKI